MASSEQQRLKPLLGEIHRYWFGVLESPTDLPAGKKGMWFQQSDATDAYIRGHFSNAIPEAAACDWDLEALTKEEQVGLVLLFDQFPRNVFRNSPTAFAYDGKARSIAGRVPRGDLRRFALIERLFLAIPFDHCENIADQDFAIWLMAGIAVDAAESFPDYARWALDSFIVHRDLIRRFGRFPHRNAALGRTSSEAELEFLSAAPRGNASNPTADLSLSRK